MRPAIVLVVGVLVALFAPGVAQAHGVTTVASGLDNPRGLAFAADGSLYVAEAGKGGAGPCFPGPNGGPVCWGTSGAITKIGHGGQKRVVTGLSSIANPDGSQAMGPSDVSVQGHDVLYTVGFGAAPAARAALPDGGANAGWLLKLGRRKVADIAGYEATADPDKRGPETNPNSVVATPWGSAVADAAGNTLVWVGRNGTVSTVAVLPELTVGGAPVHAVPTSVVIGPDGAFYVSQLTGFPFPPGQANIFRVVPGHAPTVYASGLTNVIDLAFDRHGSLYALEVSHAGLASGDLTGALIKVRRDGSQQVVMSTGLFGPGGLAIRGGAAYVSNCGVCPAGGTILRIPLP
ncbi:ScyD/ScyE family protein [Actinocrispum sp. NPDC049592]|uniref:ScyD/ScyE family protein n=1 Tax=Actinocrispum sp. NPDC049592 TaxID=3154835 RepID=UPI00344538EF